MENTILEILKDNSRALSVYQINDLLDLKSSDELKELQIVLNKMVNDMKICQSKKGKYLLFENSHYKIGRLSIHRSYNFGFVEGEGFPDIKIDARDFNDAKHRDMVVVETSKKNPAEGKIIKVIERDHSNLVGEFYIENGIGFVKMDNTRYKDYLIDLNDSKGAVPGHKVYVRKIEDLPNGKQKGEIIKIIGHKDDVGVDISSIVYEYGIPIDFNDDVEKELEDIPTSVTESDLVGRRDLRGETIVTIDGADAKDFDDGISIKKLPNGHYMLGVHIADVSHYVKEDSAIGKDAHERGTSVYLVDRVIPMLPHQLSNGICSLNEGVDRLTLSCEMEIDPNGNIRNYDIYTAVINSKKRMTYKDVNAILENNEKVEGYESFEDNLHLMSDLADALRENMKRRGYLDFDTDEMKIIVDKEGNPIEITTRDRGTGEKIIEMFMIAANEAVATYVHWLEKEMIYRVHEIPDEKKIQELINFLSGYGIKLDGKSKRFTSKLMQEVLSIFSEMEAKEVYSSIALRSMKKARYSPDNLGHFGLGSKLYTHFTSPIRRLPDLIVHRIIKNSLQIKGFDKNYTYDQLAVWAEHASFTEDRSVKCERAVEKYEAARYMEDHIGEEYEAVISGVTRDGIWIQLKNLIEGLIKISEIGKDYYDFDEKLLLIKGRKTGRIYKIGDKVEVVVTGASRETSEIDFAFVKKDKGSDGIEKKRSLNVKKVLLALLLLVVMFGSAFLFLKDKDFFKGKPNNSDIEEEEKEPEEEKPKEYSLDMIMVGDVLIHSLVYRDAKVGDTYNFMPMFENIKDTIAEHDLAFCNMETPFGGKELGYSGYPTFNTPHEIGDNLIDLGFNLFSLATNHTMDKGAKGAINSLNYWNSKENILTAGSYLSEEARKEVRIREKNNIKYTMLAYLGTWTNHALPSNQQYLLNMYDKEKVKADIERVRDEVDLLIVSMHWGQEYKLEPNAKQREMAEYLASLGVDIIIGHHTHSVQPIEYIGNTLVFYSLGNFISNQPNYDDLIGLMPTLKVTKTVDKDNNVTMQISDVEANLIYTAYDGTRCELCYHSNYRIIPFGQLTPEILPQYKTYYDKYKTVLTSLDPDIVVGPIDE